MSSVRQSYTVTYFSRGSRIEEELGVDTGQFRGKLEASIFLIKHSNAINHNQWNNFTRLGICPVCKMVWLASIKIKWLSPILKDKSKNL